MPPIPSADVAPEAVQTVSISVRIRPGANGSVKKNGPECDGARADRDEIERIVSCADATHADNGQVDCVGARLDTCERNRTKGWSGYPPAPRPRSGRRLASRASPRIVFTSERPSAPTRQPHARSPHVPGRRRELRVDGLCRHGSRSGYELRGGFGRLLDIGARQIRSMTSTEFSPSSRWQSSA